MTDAVKLEKLKAKALKADRAWQREQMLYEKLLTPSVVRLGLMAGIIAYSTYCARSKENVGPIASALAFALPGIGIPLLAAEAGVKDKFALAAMSAAGVGYTTGQMAQGWAPSQLWQALTPWND
jgi:hypothetical protein